jgi:leader peptidase (prepilin peptidase)/N-methyltransferase
MLGAWAGWQSLPLTILLSSVLGAIVGISLMMFKGHGREVPIPFGPYLALAGWITLIWGDQIVAWYLGNGVHAP